MSEILDLSELGAAPVKVKLPDGELYDMVDPNTLGPLPLQRFISRYKRAMEIFNKSDRDVDDVHEMMELLMDVACMILPGAARDTVGLMSPAAINKLAEAFYGASPSAMVAGEATLRPQGKPSPASSGSTGATHSAG